MAAGQGFKTFTTGEVLTAGDVNGYLMQGVLVFASAAARDAAITAPAEGQFAFTKDTNGLWFYDGAAWVASGATGDIEGVTAGIGISGGGTSGTVTVTNSMATAIDAKGDLVPGTGADTFARLAVGANGETLVADSSTATGLKWAAPATGMTNPMTTTGDLIFSNPNSTPVRRGIGTTGQVLRVAGGVPTWETLPSSAPSSATAYVATAQTTTSSSYTDLATSGPAVTMTTGTKALVIINITSQGDANSARGGAVSFDISGATTLAASDKYSFRVYNAVSNVQVGACQAFIMTGLTAGSNTFTAKYKSLNSPSTNEFSLRHINVIDLGS